MIESLFNTKEIKFWNWFQKNSGDYLALNKDNQEYLFGNLRERLKKIDTHLTFEFSSMLDNGIREFIISADGIKDSFPSVKKLVKLAPNIPSWNIIAFRQPKSGFKQITFKGVTLKFDDIYFRYSKDNGKLAIELNIRGYKDEKNWIATSFLILDMVLGEYDTEMRLSWINRKPLDESEVNILYNISELPMILEDYKKEWCN